LANMGFVKKGNSLFRIGNMQMVATYMLVRCVKTRHIGIEMASNNFSVTVHIAVQEWLILKNEKKMMKNTNDTSVPC